MRTYTITVYPDGAGTYSSACGTLAEPGIWKCGHDRTLDEAVMDAARALIDVIADEEDGDTSPG